MIRVLVVDDEAIVRQGLRTILESAGDVHVVGESATGAEGVADARALAPDVVLMDVRMPHTDGIAATREIVGMRTGAQVVVLTTFPLDEYVDAALAAGAAGFLVKDTPPHDLLRGVRAVARGEAIISPSVTRRLLDSLAERAPVVTAEERARLESLTARETEVLALLARGMSNEDVATTLFMSLSTVKTHVSRILGKLGAENRVQAAILAHTAGIG